MKTQLQIWWIYMLKYEYRGINKYLFAPDPLCAGPCRYQYWPVCGEKVTNTRRQWTVCVLRQQQISDCVVQTWHICPQPFWVGQEKVTFKYAVCVCV